MISKEGEKTYVDFIYIWQNNFVDHNFYSIYGHTHLHYVVGVAVTRWYEFIYLGCCAVAFYFTFYYDSIFMSFDRNYQA